MRFDHTSVFKNNDAPTNARGLAVFVGQKVRSVALQRAPGGTPGHWRVSGKVQGTQREPYQVEVEMFLEPGQVQVARWHSHCSCPVGRQCKHAVALLIKAAYQGLPTQETAAPEPAAEKSASPKSMPAIDQLAQRRQQLQAQAERWLQQAELHPHAQHPREAGGASSQWPVYLLHLVPASGSHTRQVLHLSLGVASPKAKGTGWTKPRRVPASHFAQQRPGHGALTQQDRDILVLLAALPAPYGSYRTTGLDEWALNSVAAALVLERAAATQRLFWREERETVGAAMTWGASRSLGWQWVEEPGPTPADALWQLQHSLNPTQAQLCLNQPLLYLDLSTQQCGPVLDNTPSTQLRELLQAPALPLRVIQANPLALQRRLGHQVPPPPMLPSLRRLGGTPVWRLHISQLSETGMADDAPAHALCAQLDFDYQGCQGWWPHAENPVLFEREQGERVLLQRDLTSEAQAQAQLQQLRLHELTEGLYVRMPGDDQNTWLRWVDAQFEPLKAAGFEVTLDADLQHWVHRAGEISVALTAPGGADANPSWFDLSLGLDVQGKRINLLPWLPQIIAELQQSERSAELQWPEHIYLPEADGRRFLRVATEPLRPWLDGLLELFDERDRDFSAESLRISRVDALRARVALGEGVQWQGAQSISDMATQLKEHTGLPSTPLPPGLQASLRPYQQQGLDWLQFLRQHGLAGILADDMGLGKTLQTLAHIQCEKEAARLDRPVLVVAPVSLLGNWQREAARFCPGLRCLVLHGSARHAQAEDLSQTDLVIAPYSLLHRDRQRWLAQAWHLVVLDEAQNIKNAATQASQVAGELNTRHRLCLSGTPIENHLGEIWSLFHFLMPGFLGSQQRFSQRFRMPIEKHGDPQRMAQLRARLTPFILRRTKDVVAGELPPKVETLMSVELGSKQADLYESIRLSMEQTVRQAITDKGLAKSQIAILDALLKLRQVCCDPRLVKTTAAAKVKNSAKLEQLMEMLPEMLVEGRRILLFSAFTSMLSLIEEALKKRNIPWVKLTGQTQKRDDVIERFTSGQVPLFLISLKAGGVGLNLPQADTVIHYDPWWNPAAENQATDRAHRIGQTQSVWVLKLVARGTIEERILALQERKAELARELYSGSVARKQALFTQDDVQALLRPMD